MTEFVINRSTLLAGAALRAVKAAGYDSSLYHSLTGLSCTIGQYLLANGVRPQAMAYRTSPATLICELPSNTKWLRHSPNIASTDAEMIAETNDSKLHQVRREAKTRKLFARQNINVTFTGRYADATMRAKHSLSN